MMEITVCFDKYLSFVRTQAIALLGPHMSKCGEYTFQWSRASWSRMKSSHQSTKFSWNALLTSLPSFPWLAITCLAYVEFAPLSGCRNWAAPLTAYVCCEPSCNRTNPAGVATFRCFVPQLERATRTTGRVPLGRPYRSTRTLTTGQGRKEEEEERRRNLFATNNNNIKQEKHSIKVSS